ncbi:hypothetical protein [Thermomicrobium sp.]
MHQTVPWIATLLEADFPPRFARWIAAPAQRTPLDAALPAIWWRSQVCSLVLRLSPPHRRGDRASLLYALHLAGASTTRLATVTGLEESHIIDALLAVRAELSDHWTDPCPEGREEVASWRDRLADRDAWLALLLHTRTCSACRTALATSREVDARVLERASTAPVPPLSAPRQRRHSSIVVLVALALLLVVASWRLPGNRAVGTPGDTAAPPASGPYVWFGSAGPYALAFDLGQRRWLPVTSRLPADAGGFRLLGPDGQLIAAWTPDPPREPRWLDILRWDGTRLARYRWDRQTNRRPLAWLDATTLLIRETPVRHAYEREAEYLERLQRDARVLALDVLRGTETTLLHELVTDAIPSPDGRRVAVVRAMEPFGAGATSRQIAILERSGTRLLAVADGYVGAGLDHPLWLPDSSALLFARRPPGKPPQLPTPTELVRLTTDGTTTIVVPSSPGTVLRPLALDERRLFYLALPAGHAEPGELWELDLATNARRRLGQLDRLNGFLTVLPQPDSPLLIAVRTLPTSPPLRPESEVTELYRIGDDAPELIAAAPGRWGFDAWGQPLAVATPTAPPATASPPAPPNGPLGAGPLALAPGRNWLLAPVPDGRIAIWDATSGIQLTEPWPLRKPHWHPAGLAFVALSELGELQLVARSPDGFWNAVPLALDAPRRDALDLAFGPDGRLALLTRTDGSDLVLWTGFPPQAIELAQWHGPELVGRPCMAWLRAGELLVAAPLASGQLVLTSLTVEERDAVKVRTLARLRIDRGSAVETCTLALEPSGRAVALRAGSRERERIVLLWLAEPDSPLILAEGRASSGLAWSPDGTLLAAPLDGALVVHGRNGREVLRRPTAGLADLMWVDTRELWVLERSEAGSEVHRVAIVDLSEAPTRAAR